MVRHRLRRSGHGFFPQNAATLFITFRPRLKYAAAPAPMTAAVEGSGDGIGGQHPNDSLIAKDSVFSTLAELRVQIAATIAVSSFRSSATPDQTLSFRINRPGNLREQLRTGLVSQSATAVHQLAAGRSHTERSGVKAHANNLPHSVYIDSSSPLQAASGWSEPSWHTGGPGARGGCHCVLAERMPATAVTTRSQHSHVTGGLAAQARLPARVLFIASVSA